MTPHSRLCRVMQCGSLSDMLVEVLNTGTELLTGHTVNTHAAWFGRELLPMGLRVARQTTVPDGEAIREAMSEALGRCDVLLVTGGLGPTSDDLTREITAEVMGLELMQDEFALRSLEAFFALRNRPMAPSNLKQALVPTGADVLPNANGTAPGVYLPPRLSPDGRTAVFLLPGPPRELYPMFSSEVVPRLRALADGAPAPTLQVLKFSGIGESDFHQGVDAQLAAIAGLEFGYCAHIGEVDLRLIGSPQAVAAGRNLALDVFGTHLVSDDGSSLEETLVRRLAAKGMTLATAESCTGGLISHRITDVPGASAVLTFGFVTYSNTAKTTCLGVRAETLLHHGAVSREAAIEMAEGARRTAGSDIAVAVTGIAGPGGGSAEKPVGTAWISVAARGRDTNAFRVFHPRNRHDFKLAVSQAALFAVKTAIG